MRRRSFISLLLITGLACFAAPAATMAANLDSASALFTSTDPSGCVSTEVHVLSHTGRNGLSPEVSIHVSQTNDCTEQDVIVASGSVKLGKNALQVGNKASWATLTASVPLTDLVSNRTISVDVNLVWSPIAEAISTLNTIYYEKPGKVVKEKTKFKGTYTDAQASGSIFYGAIDLTPRPSEEGEISSLAIK
jgi:hypothetical protein